MQKFYNRESQLAALREISGNIEYSKGILSVVVGRRRVGKTRLLNEAFDSNTHQHLYLFIGRKSEKALVSEFTAILEFKLNSRFFQPTSLKDIFEYLFDYATKVPLTIVIDEFQDIERVEPGLFSDLQNLWVSYKKSAMLHLDNLDDLLAEYAY